MLVFFCHVYDKLNGVTVKRASYIAFAEFTFLRLFVKPTRLSIPMLAVCCFAFNRMIIIKSWWCGRTGYITSMLLASFTTNQICFPYTQCVAMWPDEWKKKRWYHWYVVTTRNGFLLQKKYTQSGYRRKWWVFFNQTVPDFLFQSPASHCSCIMCILCNAKNTVSFREMRIHFMGEHKIHALYQSIGY